MDDRELIRSGLTEMSRLASEVAESQTDDVWEIAKLTVRVLQSGGRLFFCGNGGSAADAQHLAAEYVVRFKRARAPIPAVALTTDTSVLTASGNDYGFHSVFARQIEALCRGEDLLFLHSTSGESENLIRAAQSAGTLGMATVALLAKGGGRLKDVVDRSLIIPTRDTARAQELHLALGHLICDVVDRTFAEESA